MPNDSTIYLITVPEYDAADTVINTDLDRAVEADYSVLGLNLKPLRTSAPKAVATAAWQKGVEGTPRPMSVGENSGVLSIVTVMFVMIMLSYKYCRKLFSTLTGELLGMRHRANVFDERTSNESQVIALLAVQWCVYTGLLLYTYIANRYTVDTSLAFVDSIKLIALTGAYYIFQLCAYTTVGYTFSTPEGRRYFVKGFTSSQSLLGFALAIPTLVAIFYQQTASTMIVLAAILYFSARMVFIVKGFRIFYHKIESLLYFILYLCTLEIIPLIIIYKLALELVV